MTGPEHYREAEADLAAMDGKSPEGVRVLLARAQAHATLALAAAAAVMLPQARAGGFGDYDAWYKVAGEPQS